MKNDCQFVIQFTCACSIDQYRYICYFICNGMRLKWVKFTETQILLTCCDRLSDMFDAYSNISMFRISKKTEFLIGHDRLCLLSLTWTLYCSKAQLSHVQYSSHYPTRLEVYCAFGMRRRSTGDWILSLKQKWWSLREVRQDKANSGQSIV